MDPFAITIVLIFVCAFVGSFLQGRTRDRCLKDFAKDTVVIVQKSGKKIKGTFNLESTAMEIVFDRDHCEVEDKYPVANHIIYKSEFSDITKIIRYIDELSAKQKKIRNLRLKRAIKPRLLSKIRRHTRNVFATIRDSAMELLTLVIGRVKTMGGVGTVLAGQDKYVSQLQGQVTGSFGFAYEAMLERYIGKEIVFFVKDTEPVCYKGILKEYTAAYLEVWDVEQSTEQKQEIKADIVIPRDIAIVRHAVL